MKAKGRRWNLAGQMPLVSLIVLCAATALLTNRFLSPFNLSNVLVQSSIMAVIAMGMTFVIVGGGFDLSVGSTAALSGCVAGMVMLEAGIAAGVAAGILAGAATASAAGTINAAVSAAMRALNMRIPPCQRSVTIHRASDPASSGFGQPPSSALITDYSPCESVAFRRRRRQ